MADNPSYQPISGTVLPRFAGLATFMRLPHVALDDTDDVQIGLIGVPFDGGTTNRPGARHGPRALRDMSTMARQLNPVTGIRPFHLANCADLGDAPVNPADVEDTVDRITRFYSEVRARGISPLSAGGDHLVALPILRGLVEDGPVGLIQFDAHTDLYPPYFGGYEYTHGTPFRLAIEEGLIDPLRAVQIGIRGSAYGFDDIDYARDKGVRLIRIEEVMARGIDEVMEEARAIIGSEPCYCSFDIDVLDPAFAPGTGTPEIGGLTSYMAQRAVRALDGMDLIGADLVEVSPPFDPQGTTALAGAALLFELLCPLATSVARRAGAAEHEEA